MEMLEKGDASETKADATNAYYYIPDILSRRWAIDLLSKLKAEGPLRFNEIKRQLPGISSKTLSNCLDVLYAASLVDQNIARDNKPYLLTTEGNELSQIVDSATAGNTLIQTVFARKHLVNILSELYHNPMGFNELVRYMKKYGNVNIPNKTLSQSLKLAEKNGLVKRKMVSEKPIKVQYSLTKDGESFYNQYIEPIMVWEQHYKSTSRSFSKAPRQL